MIFSFKQGICYYLLNIYSDENHLAIEYLENTNLILFNIIYIGGDFNIKDTK